jgi:hypothetical protein
MKKKDKIEASVVGVLILVLVFLVIHGVRKPRQDRGLKVKPALKKDTSLAARPEYKDKDIFKMLEEESKNLELKRDPFGSGAIMSADVSISGLYLDGILWDKDKPMAIISGNIVKRGDKIGEYLVVDIKQEAVILNDGNNDLSLSVGESKE